MPAAFGPMDAGTRHHERKAVAERVAGTWPPGGSDDPGAKSADSLATTPTPNHGDGIDMGRSAQRLRVPTLRTQEFEGKRGRITT
jgi:hypothetical protein